MSTHNTSYKPVIGNLQNGPGTQRGALVKGSFTLGVRSTAWQVHSCNRSIELLGQWAMGHLMTRITSTARGQQEESSCQRIRARYWRSLVQGRAMVSFMSCATLSAQIMWVCIVASLTGSAGSVMAMGIDVASAPCLTNSKKCILGVHTSAQFAVLWIISTVLCGDLIEYLLRYELSKCTEHRRKRIPPMISIKASIV